jgi:Holliday junction DNA helicase RuvA
MIGKLQGTVDFVGDDYIIMMAGDVGYKVFVPDASRLATGDWRHTLWIETIVREDSIRLFGFASRAQQEMFNKLTGISGVGPKVAMAILGAFNENTLMAALATGDVKTLTAAPGVGKKMAEKIALEFKDKNLGFDIVSQQSETGGSAYGDTLSALESLGYRRADVLELAQRLARENPGSGAEKLVPLALREISK